MQGVQKTTQPITVSPCPAGCPKSHLVTISYQHVPVEGIMMAVSSREVSGSSTATEVRRVIATCPNGKGPFTLQVTVPVDADSIHVDSVTNIS